MRVGLVGAGLQGNRRAQALKQSGRGSEHAELVLVADADLERARALAEEMGCQATADWEEVVEREDVEIIIVCTPPHLHAPVSLAAMSREKHVLCEKPLARTVVEAQKMVDVAKERGVVLKCGFNLRHHPGVLQARRWVDEGMIGELISLRCRYGVGGREGYEQEWRTKAELSGGGQIMDQGVHALDLARWFLGEFQEAFAFTETLFWDIEPVEDNGFCLLRTSERQVASIHVSWTQWKPLFSLELLGKDGYITVEGLGGAYGVERVSMGLRDFTAPFREEVIEYRGDDGSWEEEWREMLRAIKGHSQPTGSGGDGLRAMELADALYRSAKEGRVIRLAPPRKVLDNA